MACHPGQRMLDVGISWERVSRKIKLMLLLAACDQCCYGRNADASREIAHEVQKPRNLVTCFRWCSNERDRVNRNEQKSQARRLITAPQHCRVVISTVVPYSVAPSMSMSRLDTAKLELRNRRKFKIGYLLFNSRIVKLTKAAHDTIVKIVIKDELNQSSRWPLSNTTCNAPSPVPTNTRPVKSMGWRLDSFLAFTM